MNVQFKDISSLVRENKKGIIGAFGSAVFIAIAWYGFLTYKAIREERAHRDFAQALQYFEAPVGRKNIKTFDIDALDASFQTEPEKWEKVSQIFQAGYEKHSSSNLAPFFLVYASDAYAKLGKYDSALSSLEAAYSSMGSNKVFKGLYGVKLAQMRLDSKEQDIRNKGIAVLKELAFDEKGLTQDLALYALGDYYWNIKNFSDAKNYWSQLTLKFGPQTTNPSPWARQANERLALVTTGN